MERREPAVGAAEEATIRLETTPGRGFYVPPVEFKSDEVVRDVTGGIGIDDDQIVRVGATGGDRRSAFFQRTIVRLR